MLQQIGRILIDSIGAGLLELILTVAAGKQTDPKRPGAACGEKIPDAVTDHDRIANVDVQTRRRHVIVKWFREVDAARREALIDEIAAIGPF